MQLPTGMSQQQFLQAFHNFIEAKKDFNTRQDLKRFKSVDSIPKDEYLESCRSWNITDKGVSYMQANYGSLGKRGLVSEMLNAMLDIGTNGKPSKIDTAVKLLLRVGFITCDDILNVEDWT